MFVFEIFDEFVILWSWDCFYCCCCFYCFLPWNLKNSWKNFPFLRIAVFHHIQVLDSWEINGKFFVTLKLKMKNGKTEKRTNKRTFHTFSFFFVYFWIFTKNHKVCKMMKLKPKKTIQIQIEFLLMELLLLARNLHKCLLSIGIEHFQLRNYFDFQSATNDTSSWIIFFWKPMGIERKRMENKVRDIFWSFIRIGRVIHLFITKWLAEHRKLSKYWTEVKIITFKNIFE